MVLRFGSSWAIEPVLSLSRRLEQSTNPTIFCSLRSAMRISRARRISFYATDSDVNEHASRPAAQDC